MGVSRGRGKQRSCDTQPLVPPLHPPFLSSLDTVDVDQHRSALDAALAALLKVSSSLLVQEEVEGEDLAHAVDDEMAATEKAVSDAVDKIQEMLKRTKETDKGQKLEVNSSILEACTTLMEVGRQGYIGAIVAVSRLCTVKPLHTPLV